MITQRVSFKIGDVVAANTINGIELGMISEGDPNKNQIVVNWTDGKTLTHNLNEVAQYRMFYLGKVMQA